MCPQKFSPVVIASHLQPQVPPDTVLLEVAARNKPVLCSHRVDRNRRSMGSQCRLWAIRVNEQSFSTPDGGQRGCTLVK